MATVPQEEVRVTVGVDTHEDVHVAVALDQLGRGLGQAAVPTTRRGYALGPDRQAAAVVARQPPHPAPPPG